MGTLPIAIPSLAARFDSTETLLYKFPSPLNPLLSVLLPSSDLSISTLLSLSLEMVELPMSARNDARNELKWLYFPMTRIEDSASKVQL